MMDEDAYVVVSSKRIEEENCLVFTVRAKQRVVLLELQGNTADLEALGAQMPPGFRKMQFGAGVEVPEGMKADVEFMNRSQFRWGFDIPLAPGAESVLQIPSSRAGKDRAVFTLVYGFPRFLGLLQGKSAIYLRYAAA